MLIGINLTLGTRLSKKKKKICKRKDIQQIEQKREYKNMTNDILTKIIIKR